MKRVRKDVCHVWAHQLQSDARFGNIFFEGDTIYSYGSHFPIARHVTHKGKHVILFTTRSYSSTTAGHKSEVRYAIPSGVPVFYVDDVTEKPSKANLDNYAKRIAYQAEVVTRAKSRMERDLEQLQNLVNEANAFCETFGFKTRFTMPANVDEMKALAAEQTAKAQRAAKAREKQAKEKRAKEAAEQLEKLEQWRQGASVYCGRVDGYDYLRLNGDEVETTQNAVVPLKHVNRVAKLILKKATAETEWHTNGETIRVGEYHLESIGVNGDVRIGCHLFSRAEIERFAALIGVK